MRYLIVGASAAGLSAAETLLSLHPAADVTVVSEEPEAPYCRPLISYWLAGEAPESLLPLPSPALDRVELRLGARVAALAPLDRHVLLASGERLGYDRCLLATGAASAPLGIPGEQLPNVRGFRTLEDARILDDELRRGAGRAVVLGGGLVGVKAAQALAARGLSVTLCIASAHPLSQVADATIGELICAALRDEGIEVRTGALPDALEDHDRRAARVVFRDAAPPVPCDLAVVGKGVAPRGELLADLGIDARAGIPVDRCLRTPVPDVWAAGDGVLAFDVARRVPWVNALWPLAVEQGACAARNMAGVSEPYAGALAMNSLKLGGLELISAGITRPTEERYETRSALDARRGWYRKVVLREGVLVGALFAGAPEQAGLLVSAIRRGARIEELPFDPLEPTSTGDATLFHRRPHEDRRHPTGALRRLPAVHGRVRGSALPLPNPLRGDL